MECSVLYLFKFLITPIRVHCYFLSSWYEGHTWPLGIDVCVTGRTDYNRGEICKRLFLHVDKKVYDSDYLLLTPLLATHNSSVKTFHCHLAHIMSIRLWNCLLFLLSSFLCFLMLSSLFNFFHNLLSITFSLLLPPLHSSINPLLVPSLSPSFYQHTHTYTYLYGLWFIRSAYGTSASSSPPILRERRAARLNYKLPHIFRYEINVKS